MIECFKTSVEEDESGERVSLTSRVAGPCPGCWVSVVAPTKRERAWMQNEMGVIPDFVASALDDEESSRIERDDETRQVLAESCDCPFVEDKSDAESTSTVQYDTHPLAVLFLPEKDLVMTVSLKENWTVSALESGRVRDINTTQRTRFLLQILLHISKRYQIDLRSVNRQFRENERELRRSVRNEELIKMLGFEKSLVYFSTSLKALDTTIQRISYGRILKLYDEDRDLLNDTSIEVKQAIEMCEIYTQVYNETMETFGSMHQQQPQPHNAHPRHHHACAFGPHDGLLVLRHEHRASHGRDLGVPGHTLTGALYFCDVLDPEEPRRQIGVGAVALKRDPTPVPATWWQARHFALRRRPIATSLGLASTRQIPLPRRACAH